MEELWNVLPFYAFLYSNDIHTSTQCIKINMVQHKKSLKHAEMPCHFRLYTVIIFTQHKYWTGFFSSIQISDKFSYKDEASTDRPMSGLKETTHHVEKSCLLEKQKPTKKPAMINQTKDLGSI